MGSISTLPKKGSISLEKHLISCHSHQLNLTMGESDDFKFKKQNSQVLPLKNGNLSIRKIEKRRRFSFIQ